ncbi:hypothetical protein EKD04_017795 [Chloroflexales bacterium ZM16-3]|nr:hypothetical protein [Chloroflexales bacterium ZM16-3]
MRTSELQTPDRPERCCATCRWWIVGKVGQAWCRVAGVALPEALTAVVCVAYDQEMQETEAVELFARLRAGGGAA